MSSETIHPDPEICHGGGIMGHPSTRLRSMQQRLAAPPRHERFGASRMRLGTSLKQPDALENRLMPGTTWGHQEGGHRLNALLHALLLCIIPP